MPTPRTDGYPFRIARARTGLGLFATEVIPKGVRIVEYTGKIITNAEADAMPAKAACEKARQNASNQGAVVGGVAGAVIGSQVAGSGAKSEGGVLGGVAGVLAGRQIARDQNRC